MGDQFFNLLSFFHGGEMCDLQQGGTLVMAFDLQIPMSS